MKRKTKKKIRSLWRNGGLFIFLLKKVVHSLHLSHFFVAKRKYYEALIFHDPFSFWLWTHSDTLREDEEFFAKFLRPSDSVIDAGTNVGTLTLTASKIVGDTGRVFAFEPHPQTFRYMKENCEYNKCKNVTTFNFGIGKTHEYVRMLDEYTKDINHIDPNGPVPVEIVPLDDCDIPTDNIALLKIDVEGYELFGLEGATNILAKTDGVYFESSPKNFTRFGYTLKDILLLLEKQGFQNYTIASDWTLVPVSHDHQTKVKYENILALKNRDFYEKRVLIDTH